LENARLDDYPVEACRGCAGVLLVDAMFAEVVRVRRAAYNGPERMATPIDITQYDTQRNCPGCGRPMETHPYYGPGNQVIDSCATCGYIWLDSGELAAIEQVSGAR